MRYIALLLAVVSSLVVTDSNQRLGVTVYYETLCPDSVAFITRQLYPSWTSLGGETVLDLHLVPFGKSQSDRFGAFSCQHGPRECAGNMMQSCALSLLPPGTKQVNFVHCIMSSRTPDKAGEMCAAKSGISWPAVENCIHSGDGQRLQLIAEAETKTVRPTFVPTVTFNGVFSQQDQQEAQYNFAGVVCRHLRQSAIQPTVCS